HPVGIRDEPVAGRCMTQHLEDTLCLFKRPQFTPYSAIGVTRPSQSTCRIGPSIRLAPFGPGLSVSVSQLALMCPSIMTADRWIIVRGREVRPEMRPLDQATLAARGGAQRPGYHSGAAGSAGRGPSGSGCGSSGR